jgi:hypothetical protein
MWSVGSDWHIVGVGDFNGDGFDDILWRNDDGTVTNWLGAPNGEFQSNLDDASYSVGLDWTASGTADFNGDGRADILWRNDGPSVTDWLGTTTGGFNSNWANADYSVGSNWSVAATGDFNGDGFDDILWRSDSGQVTNWLGTASGAFNSNWEAADYSIGSNWSLGGVGDFNGDGRTDIVWRSDTGQVTNWLGTASGGFTDNWDNANFSVGADWSFAGVGDFNGDGRSDILWRKDDGTITDWLGQANGGFISNDEVALEPVSADYQIAGVGDFNGDGFSDILLRSTDGTLETWVGSANGAILSPTEKLWQDALANVSAFFDELTDQIASGSPGVRYDLVSAYDMGENWAPFDQAFLDQWGWLPTVQQSPASHYWDFLTQDVDPEFQLASLFAGGFSANVNGHESSITQIGDASDNTYLIDQDGFLTRAIWHPGSVTTGGEKDPIIITGGGYWTVELINVMRFDSLAYESPSNAGNSPGALEPRDTPCVETTFLTPGISRTDANRAALAASNAIASKNDVQTFEWSSLIYAINGSVYYTTPNSDHLVDGVNWTSSDALKQIPDGAVIIGVVHNHPDDPTITDTIPSGSGREGGDDWLSYDTLVNWNRRHDDAHDLPRGITVDPNMLLWIYSNEDSKTHVYDNTDKNQDTPTCTLQ